MKNRDISTKQKAAIRALLTGASSTDAALAAKVHINTITQWMRDPVFLEALHREEGNAMKAISRSLVGIADQAAGVLKSVLADPLTRYTTRLRAADIALGRLIQIRELSELEERIRRLEEALNERLK